MENQNFKVGDRVFDLIFQDWGLVIKNTGGTFPLRVEWSDGALSPYTIDGKESELQEIPSLYHEEMEIVPKGAAIHQRVIQVKMAVDEIWKNRVLIKFLPDGRPLCWVNAKTIEDANSKTETRAWSLWQELPDPKTQTAEEIAEKIGITVDELKKIVQQC